jgi:hypothetical protein
MLDLVMLAPCSSMRFDYWGAGEVVFGLWMEEARGGRDTEREGSR